MAQTTGWVDARRVLAERDRVLAEPEFALESSWIEEWVERATTAIGRVLRAVPAPVLWALLALFCLAILIALARVMRSRGGGRSVAPHEGEVAVVPAAGYEALRARAWAAIADGGFAEAVRLTWLAALVLIARAGLSQGRAARADWEHVTAVRASRPEVADMLVALARAFQGTRFGAQESSAAQAGDCWEALSRLEAALGAPARKAA